jgi:4-hydroxy-4-methyl-2-oxoglutarate aldolase
MSDMTAASATSGYVVRLRKLDCCAISDALDKLGLTGVVSGLLQQSGSGRIAGQAITVKLGTGDPPSGAPKHLCCTAISMAGPDHVIVVEQRTGIEAGSWGGLLTLGAKLRGVAGVVADGPVRDIDEAEAYGFPIFTHSLTARTARGRIVEKATNVPVAIREVTVQPGDFVVADRSGVVFIAADRIVQVLQAAESIAAREAGIARSLLGGTPIGEAMGGHYESMLQSQRESPNPLSDREDPR